MVRLLGAISDPETTREYERLNQLRKRLLRDGPKAPAQRVPSPPPRTGEISAAVAQVLGPTRSPLRVGEIHRFVEQLLGQPVRRETVKACLVRGASAKRPKYDRVSYGRYRLIGLG
jgi:hypothetical protein